MTAMAARSSPRPWTSSPAPSRPMLRLAAARRRTTRYRSDLRSQARRLRRRAFFLSLSEMFNTFSMTDMDVASAANSIVPFSFQDCGRADGNRFAGEPRFAFLMISGSEIWPTARCAPGPREPSLGLCPSLGACRASVPVGASRKGSPAMSAKTTPFLGAEPLQISHSTPPDRTASRDDGAPPFFPAMRRRSQVLGIPPRRKKS